MPIKFDESTFYPMDELAEMLRGAVELPTFLDRLGLRHGRVFKGGLWGFEIIAAAKKAPSCEAASQPAAEVVETLARSGGPGRRSGAKPKGGSGAPLRILGAADLRR